MFFVAVVVVTVVGTKRLSCLGLLENKQTKQASKQTNKQTPLG